MFDVIIITLRQLSWIGHVCFHDAINGNQASAELRFSVAVPIGLRYGPLLLIRPRK